jgi:hypothetical protein
MTRCHAWDLGLGLIASRLAPGVQITVWKAGGRGAKVARQLEAMTMANASGYNIASRSEVFSSLCGFGFFIVS